MIFVFADQELKISRHSGIVIDFCWPEWIRLATQIFTALKTTIILRDFAREVLVG